ncbi:MAG TPA: hypothetical protein VD929_08570 [Caulobacteraceae bacterium]|nr:hypothetical protein [Caulobacteraceae bacterium]
MTGELEDQTLRAIGAVILRQLDPKSGLTPEEAYLQIVVEMGRLAKRREGQDRAAAEERSFAVPSRSEIASGQVRNVGRS